MSRCKACDKVMTDTELMRIDTVTGDYTELCSDCMVHSEAARLGFDEDVDFILGLDEVIL